MLFVLAGSSGSGKTTLAERLQPDPGLRVHDSDEIGVPEGADTAWRQRTLETWIGRALEYQRAGLDMVLAGQSPLGEVIAAPSAPLVDRIAVVLVDVADEARRARLADRDPGRWTSAELDAFVGWGRWHRRHLEDPRFSPEVITRHGTPGMIWDRWLGTERWDPRWLSTVIDTTGRTVEESGRRLESWIRAQRAGT